MIARRQHWIFFHPCGCPFGLVEARRWPGSGGPGRVMTKSEAWRDFYDTAKERNAAFDREVTAELMDHERYVAEHFEFMRSNAPCPHTEATTGTQR